MLVKYTKTPDHQKIGVIVAMSSNKVGWSRCQPEDKFNKQLGLKIAIGRALRGSKKKVPDALLRDMVEMYPKALRFYAQKREG